MAIADRHGLPVAVHVVSASPNEATLVEPTLERRFLRETPQRLIGDKAYDSDRLDRDLAERYRRRCRVERLFGWLHDFCRLVMRWEYHDENVLAWFVSGMQVLLRHLSAITRTAAPPWDRLALLDERERSLRVLPLRKEEP